MTPERRTAALAAIRDDLRNTLRGYAEFQRWWSTGKRDRQAEPLADLIDRALAQDAVRRVDGRTVEATDAEIMAAVVALRSVMEPGYADLERRMGKIIEQAREAAKPHQRKANATLARDAETLITEAMG